MRFDSKILNGLPVVVIGEQYEGEPDVGIRGPYFEVHDIQFQRGGSIPQSMWDRIERNGDLDRLQEEGISE